MRTLGTRQANWIYSHSVSEKDDCARTLGSLAKCDPLQRATRAANAMMYAYEMYVTCNKCFSESSAYASFFASFATFFAPSFSNVSTIFCTFAPRIFSS